MQRHRLILPSLAAACFAALAPGDGTAIWVELDNSVNPGNGNPTGLDDGSFDGTVYRSFALYVVLPPAWDGSGVEGNCVGAMDFGIVVSNSGLSTDGVFFQAPDPFNSDSVVVNEAAASEQNQVFFDTAVALGTKAITVTSWPVADAIVWDEAGVTGAWWPNPAANCVRPDANGAVFVARITVDGAASYLGGQCFVSDYRCYECFDPAVYIHTIPNAFLELECLGDINWDGVVDTADLGRLIASFGARWGDADFNPRADFTRDGVVDTADLGRLIQHFGQVCE